MYIDTLAVLPEFSDKKFDQMLLLSFLLKAKQKGKEKVKLHTQEIKKMKDIGGKVLWYEHGFLGLDYPYMEPYAYIEFDIDETIEILEAQVQLARKLRKEVETERYVAGLLDDLSNPFIVDIHQVYEETLEKIEELRLLGPEAKATVPKLKKIIQSGVEYDLDKDYKRKNIVFEALRALTYISPEEALQFTYDEIRTNSANADKYAGDPRYINAAYINNFWRYQKLLDSQISLIKTTKLYSKEMIPIFIAIERGPYEESLFPRNEEMKKLAAMLIYLSMGDEAIPSLMKYFDPDDPKVHPRISEDEALILIEQIEFGPNKEAAVPRILELLDENRKVGKQNALLLEIVKSFPEKYREQAYPIMIDIINDPDARPRVVENTIQVFFDMDEEKAIPVLIDILIKRDLRIYTIKRDPRIYKKIIKTLEKISTKNTRQLARDRAIVRPLVPELMNSIAETSDTERGNSIVHMLGKIFGDEVLSIFEEGLKGISEDTDFSSSENVLYGYQYAIANVLGSEFSQTKRLSSLEKQLDAIFAEREGIDLEAEVPLSLDQLEDYLKEDIEEAKEKEPDTRANVEAAVSLLKKIAMHDLSQEGKIQPLQHKVARVAALSLHQIQGEEAKPFLIEMFEIARKKDAQQMILTLTTILRDYADDPEVLELFSDYLAKKIRYEAVREIKIAMMDTLHDKYGKDAVPYLLYLMYDENPIIVEHAFDLLSRSKTEIKPYVREIIERYFEITQDDKFSENPNFGRIITNTAKRSLYFAVGENGNDLFSVLDDIDDELERSVILDYAEYVDYNFNAARLGYYAGVLKEHTVDLVNLPVAKRKQEIIRIINEADKEYLEFQRAVLYNEPVANYPAYLYLLRSLDKEEFEEDWRDLRKAYMFAGIDFKDLGFTEAVALASEKITTFDFKESVKSFEFKTDEVQKSIPSQLNINLRNEFQVILLNKADVDARDISSKLKGIEKFIDSAIAEENWDSIEKEFGVELSPGMRTPERRETIKNLIRNKKAEEFTPELEARIDQMITNGEWDALEQEYDIAISPGIRAKDKAENIKKLVRRKFELTKKEEYAILYKVLERFGMEEIEDFVNDHMSNKRKTIFLTKLVEEGDIFLEDELTTLGLGEFFQKLKRDTNLWKLIMEVKNEFKSSEQVKTTKTIELVFKKKNLLDLWQGKFSGTCFGDYPYDMAVEDILVVKIIADGELRGSLLFYKQDNMLILIGFDPSQSLVATLDRGQRSNLMHEIMTKVYDFVEENNFDFLISTQAGGLSNRGMFEEMILYHYATKDAVKVNPRTFQPQYQYTVTAPYIAEARTPPPKTFEELRKIYSGEREFRVIVFGSYENDVIPAPTDADIAAAIGISKEEYENLHEFRKRELVNKYLSQISDTSSYLHDTDTLLPPTTFNEQIKYYFPDLSYGEYAKMSIWQLGELNRRLRDIKEPAKAKEPVIGIREADWATDADKIMLIEEETFLPDAQQTEDDLEETFSFEGAVAYIIEVDGEPAGYMLGSAMENYEGLEDIEDDPDFGRRNSLYMESTAIRPLFQRMGLGTKIRIEFLKKALEKGYTKGKSHANVNSGMRDWTLKLGGRTLVEHEDWLGEPHDYMEFDIKTMLDKLQQPKEPIREEPLVIIEEPVEESIVKKAVSIEEGIFGRDSRVRGFISTRSAITAAVTFAVASIVFGMVLIFTERRGAYVPIPQEVSTIRQPGLIEEVPAERGIKTPGLETEKEQKEEAEPSTKLGPKPQNPLGEFGVSDEEFELLQKKIQAFIANYQIGDFNTNFMPFRYKEIYSEFDPEYTRTHASDKMEEYAFSQIIPVIFQKELNSISDKNLNDQMETCARLYLHVVHTRYKFTEDLNAKRMMDELIRNEVRIRLPQWLDTYRTVMLLGTDEEYKALGFEAPRVMGGNIKMHLSNLYLNGLMPKEEYEEAKETVLTTITEYVKTREESAIKKSVSIEESLEDIVEQLTPENMYFVQGMQANTYLVPFDGQRLFIKKHKTDYWTDPERKNLPVHIAEKLSREALVREALVLSELKGLKMVPQFVSLFVRKDGVVEQVDDIESLLNAMEISEAGDDLFKADYFLATEMIEGSGPGGAAMTLQDYLQTGGTISRAEWLEIAEFVTDELHARKISHNDIHIGNILINEETREFYLADFGTAERKTTSFHIDLIKINDLAYIIDRYNAWTRPSFKEMAALFMYNVYSIGQSVFRTVDRVKSWFRISPRVKEEPVAFREEVVEPSLEVLIADLHIPDKRDAAITALGRMGLEAKEAIPMLNILYRDANLKTAGEAARDIQDAVVKEGSSLENLVVSERTSIKGAQSNTYYGVYGGKGVVIKVPKSEMEIQDLINYDLTKGLLKLAEMYRDNGWYKEALVMQDIDEANIPGIPKLIAMDEENNFIVVERKPGIPLSNALIEHHIPLEVWREFKDRTIQEMHRKGFAHNDLHMGNILYDPETQQFSLIDLGRAVNQKKDPLNIFGGAVLNDDKHIQEIELVLIMQDEIQAKAKELTETFDVFFPSDAWRVARLIVEYEYAKSLPENEMKGFLEKIIFSRYKPSIYSADLIGYYDGLVTEIRTIINPPTESIDVMIVGNQKIIPISGDAVRNIEAGSGGSELLKTLLEEEREQLEMEG
ncbi:GNAT family N-acetyltransferase [Candidatus Woesearchaeota archaeon]|nr:GNAT family N-acetyltransferase [Candidatus Woesearchaeota archaeon]